MKNLKELKLKLAALNDIDEETKKKIVCSLVGHSKIQTLFFGYYYCARCEQQVGDSLGGYYPDADKAVIVGHKCEICEKNYKNLTWKDKFMAPTKKEIFK